MQPPVSLWRTERRYGKTATWRKRRPGPKKESGHGQIKTDMMIFWGMHSHGRFDVPTICYALDSGPEDVEHELGSLADLGIVSREVEGGVTRYSLTRDEDKRRAIVERVSPGHTES